MLRNKYVMFAPLGLLSLTVLSGAFLMSSYSHATDDSAVDNVSVNVPVSCTMSGTGMNSHNANIVNGTYQADIGTTTLKAFCNDNNGFAIYAIGFTDDEYGKTVLTNSTLGTSADIATGTATSGSTSNWAMKLATNTSATYTLTLDNGFSSYSSVPATYTKVAHRDSGTDTGTSATGSELTSTYAAYMNQTQPAGTYTGQVKYALVHPASEEPLQPRPATAGCINYFANASTTVGEMGCQSATNNASVTLWASNFKRDGYGFAGWNDKFDYSGNFYGPNQTITAPADVQTNGLSLYAVWIKSAGTIQNWNGCSSLVQGATTALTDERDSNTYAVAKLADGKCWMIENLRLNDVPELSDENTNNPSLPLINSSYTTSNHLSPNSTKYDGQTENTGGWCNVVGSSFCINRSNLSTRNTTAFIDKTASNYYSLGDNYSSGNYYNWYSATAGNGTYGTDINNYSVNGDICPRGWRLPKGGDKDNSTNSDFWQLGLLVIGNVPTNTSSAVRPYYTGDSEGDNASTALRTYPNNIVYSGRMYAATVSDPKIAYYWSSSASSGNDAYYFLLTDSSVYPGTTHNAKYIGYTIRCIAGV